MKTLVAWLSHRVRTNRDLQVADRLGEEQFAIQKLKLDIEGDSEPPATREQIRFWRRETRNGNLAGGVGLIASLGIGIIAYKLLPAVIPASTGFLQVLVSGIVMIVAAGGMTVALQRQNQLNRMVHAVLEHGAMLAIVSLMVVGIWAREVGQEIDAFNRTQKGAEVQATQSEQLEERLSHVRFLWQGGIGLLFETVAVVGLLAFLASRETKDKLKDAMEVQARHEVLLDHIKEYEKISRIATAKTIPPADPVMPAERIVPQRRQVAAQRPRRALPASQRNSKKGKKS